MTVHLIHVIYVRNDLPRFQYVIVPELHAGKGRLVGAYPDVASAYHAAVAKGAGHVYLYHPDDFPFAMRDADDIRDMSWCA